MMLKDSPEEEMEAVEVVDDAGDNVNLSILFFGDSVISDEKVLLAESSEEVEEAME